MKIVTYNLRSGGKFAHWQQIQETVDPDIVLLQETYNPCEYLPNEVWERHKSQIHWVQAGQNRWGSAIFAKSGMLQPITMPEFEGYVVGVELTQFAQATVAKQAMRLFSLHAPDPYEKSVNQILDSILRLPQEHPFILGGDFNLTTGIRHPSESEYSKDKNPWLLERLRKEFNLLSCWQAANPNRDLPQTLRWSRDKDTPYHCDGIFAPASWYQYLDDCQVLAGPVWEGLSDHNPVVAMFNESLG